MPRRQAVHAKGAPSVAVSVPGDQIPATSEMDQSERLNGARSFGAIVLAVVDSQHLVVAARSCDRGQDVCIDRRAGCRDRDRVGLERIDTPAEPGRKHLLQLHERAD